MEKTQKQIRREVENVLECYSKYETKIEKYKEELRNITLNKRTSYEEIPHGFQEYKSEYEKKEDKKAFILEDIDLMGKMMFKIESALGMIKDDDYFCFIKMRYLDKMTYEEISDKLEIEVRSVYRIRNKLTDRLVFPFKTQKLL